MDHSTVAPPPSHLGAAGADRQAVHGNGTFDARKGTLCQVDNCMAPLDKAYHLRHRVCPKHLRELSVLVNGVASRFCQQCARFHDVEEFDGTKRSCRTRLQEHNARRRLKPEVEALTENAAALLRASPASTSCGPVFQDAGGSVTSGMLTAPADDAQPQGLSACAADPSGMHLQFEQSSHHGCQLHVDLEALVSSQVKPGPAITTLHTPSTASGGRRPVRAAAVAANASFAAAASLFGGPQSSPLPREASNSGASTGSGERRRRVVLSKGNLASRGSTPAALRSAPPTTHDASALAPSDEAAMLELQAMLSLPDEAEASLGTSGSSQQAVLSQRLMIHPRSAAPFVPPAAARPHSVNASGTLQRGMSGPLLLSEQHPRKRSAAQGPDSAPIAQTGQDSWAWHQGPLVQALASAPGSSSLGVGLGQPRMFGYLRQGSMSSSGSTTFVPQLVPAMILSAASPTGTHTYPGSDSWWASSASMPPMPPQPPVMHFSVPAVFSGTVATVVTTGANTLVCQSGAPLSYNSAGQVVQLQQMPQQIVTPTAQLHPVSGGNVALMAQGGASPPTTAMDTLPAPDCGGALPADMLAMLDGLVTDEDLLISGGDGKSAGPAQLLSATEPVAMPGSGQAAAGGVGLAGQNVAACGLNGASGGSVGWDGTLLSADRLVDLMAASPLQNAGILTLPRDIPAAPGPSTLMMTPATAPQATLPGGLPGSEAAGMLQAISLKVANCLPHQLTPDLYQRLCNLVSTSTPAALHAILQQGVCL